jgi:hypothetical protein
MPSDTIIENRIFHCVRNRVFSLPTPELKKEDKPLFYWFMIRVRPRVKDMFPGRSAIGLAGVGSQE